RFITPLLSAPSPSPHLTPSPVSPSFFFFNDPATPEIYTLSLHDALPIFARWRAASGSDEEPRLIGFTPDRWAPHWYVQKPISLRSEEHTSELQSLTNLVCRLLLEKKKNTK